MATNNKLITESLWDIEKRLDVEDPYINFAIYLVSEWCEEYKEVFSRMLDRFGTPDNFPSKNDYLLKYCITKNPSAELQKKYKKKLIPRTEREVDFKKDKCIAYYILRENFHEKIAEIILPNGADETIDILERTVLRERKESMLEG